ASSAIAARWSTDRSITPRLPLSSSHHCRRPLLSPSPVSSSDLSSSPCTVVPADFDITQIRLSL
ncbi:hypothetical protein Dimus_025026, partial [Dionaea muscipula]